MRLFSILVILPALLALSCKESVTEIPASAPFSLTVTVKDTLGAPLSGLRVAGGSLLSERSLMGMTLDWWANAVYIARLTARDTAGGSVLFRDSIRMVFADVDPGTPPAILGYTEGNGRLTLHDRYRFPGTFRLPGIILTGNTGPDSVGTFTLRDTAEFVILDTLSHQSMQVKSVLVDGANSVSVVWRPSPSAIPSRQAERPGASAGAPSGTLAVTAIMFKMPSVAFIDFEITAFDGTVAQTPISQLLNSGMYMVTFSTISSSPAPLRIPAPSRIADVTAPDWRLYQNYPNPFD